MIEEICFDHISQLGCNICLVQNIYDGLLKHLPRVSVCVRCFKLSCLHSHCRHLLTMSSSQRDSFELQPNHPETCLVMKERNGLGYPKMAQLYPVHHIVSKCVDKTIPFLLKYLLAVERPQNSSNSKQRVTFFPPIVTQICLYGKVPPINCRVQCVAFKALFASLSTLMLICSFSVQSCHFFVLSAYDCTYFNLTGKG